MPVVDRVETVTEALAPRPAAPKRRVGARGDSIASSAPRGGACETSPVRYGYRPCVLSWVGGEPSDALIEQMRHEALRWDRRSLLVPVDWSTQVLLVSEDSRGGPSRQRLHDVVSSVVEVAHAARPEAQIHTVVGDRVRPGEQLAAAASRLQRLGRYAWARGGDDVVWARRYSLACLLATLDPRQASAFIEAQLAGVHAYDREHGTNLQRVLELALDHDNRNTAARAAFMHRNTFRRQLRKALGLIDVDLACPEERLALHLALKMRFSRPGSDPGPGRLAR